MKTSIKKQKLSLLDQARIVIRNTSIAHGREAAKALILAHGGTKSFMDISTDERALKAIIKGGVPPSPLMQAQEKLGDTAVALEQTIHALTDAQSMLDGSPAPVGEFLDNCLKYRQECLHGLMQAYVAHNSAYDAFHHAACIRRGAR